MTSSWSVFIELCSEGTWWNINKACSPTKTSSHYKNLFISSAHWLSQNAVDMAPAHQSGVFTVMSAHITLYSNPVCPHQSPPPPPTPPPTQTKLHPSCFVQKRQVCEKSSHMNSKLRHFYKYFRKIWRQRRNKAVYRMYLFRQENRPAGR